MISLAFRQFSQFRCFAVCRQGAGRWPSALSSQYEFASIGCAYAHMLYYYMGDTRTQISSTRMRHSEWADGAERVSSSKRGTVLFYFISFHFFSLGRGVRIGLAGSFVECHNKSSTEIQIVTQNTKPHSAERSFAGIMEFRTMRQKQPQKPSHMILYRTAKGAI